MGLTPLELASSLFARATDNDTVASGFDSLGRVDWQDCFTSDFQATANIFLLRKWDEDTGGIVTTAQRKLWDVRMIAATMSLEALTE